MYKEPEVPPAGQPPLPEETVDVSVSPRGRLELLSQLEVGKLRSASEGSLHELLRRCSLAVLNCGAHTDDAAEVFRQYRDYEIEVVPRTRGIKLKIRNAPPSAFVDGRMIRGIRDLLFAVLRDVVFISKELEDGGQFDFTRSESITNAVFHILRNASIMNTRGHTNLIVCWGGHSIGRGEYTYTKDVGYELGLRGFDICTGCGPGAMKGPMKGATIGHAKQRIRNGRYIGLTEPGIIAAESPNPIVNHLVILPDIEKRLEAFVRVGHGIVVFPGGVGTAEEILFLLGLLLHPDNADQPLSLIFTGPPESAEYFRRIDAFIGATLGSKAQQRYSIIIDDAPQVARQMLASVGEVRSQRRRTNDAFYYNWLLHIAPEFQLPFEVTHESMASLSLSRDLPVHELAANLRRVFSGIVTGNVKENGVQLVNDNGPFEIHAEPKIMGLLDDLLRSFVSQGRMKLATDYRPCYRIVA